MHFWLEMNCEKQKNYVMFSGWSVLSSGHPNLATTLHTSDWQAWVSTAMMALSLWTTL